MKPQPRYWAVIVPHASADAVYVYTNYWIAWAAAQKGTKRRLTELQPNGNKQMMRYLAKIADTGVGMASAVPEQNQGGGCD